MCVDPVTIGVLVMGAAAGAAASGAIGGSGAASAPSAPAAAPEKTSSDVQRDAEQDRLRRAFSTQGFASTILPAGFGSTSSAVAAPNISKSVTLGR